MKVKSLLKTIFTTLRGGHYIVGVYFAWMLKYSRHPERYPLEERYAHVRRLILQITRAMRFDLRQEGLERFNELPPCFIVSNHQSCLDPLMVIMAHEKPLKIIAKAEARKMPFVGRILRSLGCLFLDRKDPHSAVNLFPLAIQDIQQGRCSYLLYPEGTRQKKPTEELLLPFHPGSFKIALRAHCPIVPFATFGAFRIFGSNDLCRSELLQLKCLDAIPPEDYAGKTTYEIAELCQAKVAAEVAIMQGNDAAYMESGKARHLGRKWYLEDKGTLPFSTL